MKKKLFLALMGIVLFSATVIIVPVKEVKADCPNGCLVNCGDGCNCNGWHPNLKEAKGGAGAAGGGGN